MATTVDPDGRPLLGRVMVEAGLLTEEQLGVALDEQTRTSRPLGEVIASLGFASPGAIANALAEQVGGPLRTEYGIGTGLRRRLEVVEQPPELPVAPPAAGGAPAAPASRPWSSGPEPEQSELEQLHERLERLDHERRTLLTRLNEQAAVLAAARKAAEEAEARLAEAGGPPGEPEPLRARVAELEAALAEARGSSEELRRRVAELEAAAASGLPETPRADVDSLVGRLVGLEVELAAARRERDEALRLLAVRGAE